MALPEPIPDFLANSSLKLFFFGGKGGVGKTTCACAAALALARARAPQPLLLVSTDPAHSLRDALADLCLPANLTVLELDAAASLARFKEKHEATLRRILTEGTFFDDEDVRGFLDLSLPGMDELVACLEMADWLHEDRYAAIVVDTAPTGHALRLLEMPAVVRRWLETLDLLLEKHRYLRRRFARVSAPDELDRFLLDRSAELQVLEGIMRDLARCRFVPVTVAEGMSVEESLDLLSKLHDLAVPVREFVINRVVPENDCPVCRCERARQGRALEALRARLPVPLCGWMLPLLPVEPRAEVLLSLWEGCLPLEAFTPVRVPPPDALPVRVERPAPAPPASLRWLMFAGKGGVGKTTMACATAVHLARRHPDCRILLFSSDPAHSIGDCLGLKVGAEPTPVRPGLDAQEVDAAGLFAEILAEYTQEVQRFFAAISSNVDVSFDREATERLMDLAPPGLDEIMALTVAKDHLSEGRYDLLVLDAAPSGHFLRLIEMPSLLDAWLKRFFAVLLKYREVLHVPQLAERLVRLSKELKGLQAMLRDPARAGLYAVTIPTALALEETADLLATVEQLGLSAPTLFLNQIVPPTERCSLCAAQHRRQRERLEEAAQRFPALHQVWVFRQHEPVGVAALEELGRALYR